MTAISPELVERMVKLVRDIAGLNASPNWVKTAEEIAALLPAPVDPDLEAARDIIERMFPVAPHDGTHVYAALAGIKRGRELANDGWIVWRGGECPCPGHKAEYILRSGAELGPSSADLMEWRHEYGQEKKTGRGDIIAYRIVKRAEGGK